MSGSREAVSLQRGDELRSFRFGTEGVCSGSFEVAGCSRREDISVPNATRMCLHSH